MERHTYFSFSSNLLDIKAKKQRFWCAFSQKFNALAWSDNMIVHPMPVLGPTHDSPYIIFPLMMNSDFICVPKYRRQLPQ